MSFMRKEKDGSALLKIEGAMTVNEAAELRSEMVECLDTYDGLILDLNNVSECDTAGIQLLCSARLTVQSTGKRLLVKSASMSLMDAFSRTGLNPEEILSTTNTE